MRLYVAGPMRGYDCFNFPAFASATARLRAWGHDAVSPAEMDLDAFGWPDCPPEEVLDGFDIFDAMSRDFTAILEGDGIALLPGWADSSGAKAELFVAQQTGRKVFLYVGDERAEHEDPLVPYTPVKAPVGGEVRIVSETGGAKGQKLARFDLLPWDAVWSVAERFGAGAAKYEARNWERGYDWSLTHAALHRHLAAFWNGEDMDVDPETGTFPHMAAVAWHALVLLAFYLREAGTDDRPVTYLRKDAA